MAFCDAKDAQGLMFEKSTIVFTHPIIVLLHHPIFVCPSYSVVCILASRIVYRAHTVVSTGAVEASTYSYLYNVLKRLNSCADKKLSLKTLNQLLYASHM